MSGACDNGKACLLVDVGNTSVTLAVFDGRRLRNRSRLPTRSVDPESAAAAVRKGGRWQRAAIAGFPCRGWGFPRNVNDTHRPCAGTVKRR